MRLSRYVAARCGISRRAAKDAVGNGQVRLDGRITLQDVPVIGTEHIELDIAPPPVMDQSTAGAYLVRLTERAAFFDKPSGMHTERHHPADPAVLEDALLIAAPGFSLVSRLDFGTDGIIAAIRHADTKPATKKRYLALVSGAFPETLRANNRIDAAKRRTVKVLDEPGDRPVRFALIETIGEFSLVEALLEKAGRHQLRALLAHNGHPIVGDKDYGGAAFHRLMLHSASVTVNETSCDSRLTDAFLELARTI